MVDTDKCRPVGQNGDDGQWSNQDVHAIESGAVLENATEDGTQSRQHHTLGTLHQAHLTLQIQSFGTGTHIAHHERTDDGHTRNDASPEIALKEQEIEDAERVNNSL